jgi:hypothetical protein
MKFQGEAPPIARIHVGRWRRVLFRYWLRIGHLFSEVPSRTKEGQSMTASFTSHKGHVVELRAEATAYS